MHTQKDSGLDMDLAKDLKTNFMWTPPLATTVLANSADLEGPESILAEEIEAAFAELEQQNRGTQEAALNPQLDGQEISAGKVYDFAELDWVDKGLVPTAFEEDNDQIRTESASSSWDIQSMLISKGVTMQQIYYHCLGNAKSTSNAKWISITAEHAALLIPLGIKIYTTIIIQGHFFSTKRNHP